MTKEELKTITQIAKAIAVRHSDARFIDVQKTITDQVNAAIERAGVQSIKDLAIQLRGTDGVSVAGLNINEVGDLIVTLSNGETVNAGHTVGRQGERGEKGENGERGNDGNDGEDGQDGYDGVGVARVSVNDGGHLIVTLTDSTQIDAGYVIGPEGKRGPRGMHGLDGADGVGIAGVKIDASGDLIVTLTSGDTINAGRVKGADGKTSIISGGGGGGRAGKSAYEIAVDNGFTGTEQEWLASLSGEFGGTFETVSSNLRAANSTLSYNVAGDLDAITYADGIVKSLSYDAEGDLLSVTLSGALPDGINLVKSFSYNAAGDLAAVSYGLGGAE